MSYMLEALPVLVCAMEFTLGMVGNGFIVLTNSAAWVSSRKFSLIDVILTCLAVSRICFLGVTMLMLPFKITRQDMFHLKSRVVGFDMLWTGSNYFSSACSTCLSMFYFFRIARFTSPVFLWVKWRIRKVLRVVVLAAIASYSVFLIFVKTLVKNLAQGWAPRGTNLTFNVMGRSIRNFVTQHILLNLMLLFFFVVSLVSLLLLTLSLWQHSRRMKQQGLHRSDFSTKAHVRALKTIISFLFFFIVHHVAKATVLAGSISDNAGTNRFACMLIFLNPSVHPFLLILWNSKLKQAWLHVLRMLRGEITARFYKHS
ncbi:taste receptor type 2 member 7-like [Perognathus longimembris pacificus]|uniref:taste receptor type 2 member 7-like n=1 Tax=Perognathus longimembris pacificus TaxID=214514 RepID=UPI0020199A94|nr:taste receptor type 2 member 7-like [Perognathus longimembris pacificus]